VDVSAFEDQVSVTGRVDYAGEIQRARDRVRTVEGTSNGHPPEFKNPSQAVRPGNLAAQDLDITDAVTVVSSTSPAEPDARLPEVSEGSAWVQHLSADSE
jgi:hypothetical protein